MNKTIYIFFLVITFSVYVFSETIYGNISYGIEFDKFSIKKQVEADTSISNKVLQVWATSTDLNVKIQVSDKNKQINITVYNMLGKEIVKVFEGLHVRENDPYTVNINMPNGIYICVLRGDGFRNAEKFIISR